MSGHLFSDLLSRILLSIYVSACVIVNIISIVLKCLSRYEHV